MRLEERVERLERLNRRLSAALASVLLGATALAVAGASPATPSDSVRTRRLEIVDNGGNVVVVLGHGEVVKGGYAELFDGDGHRLVGISAHMRNGAVQLWHENGNEVVTIGASEAGNGRLATHGKDGGELVTLATNARGDGELATHDSAGIALLRVSTNADGEASLGAYNRGGRLKASWP